MTDSHTTKEIALQKISQLIERFEEQKEFYKQSDYNETLTRRDFIDPFFKALGWDIDNENGYAESYREVIHEDKLKISGATKAPDYSFRLVGGKRLFFVEAKKPSVRIKDETAPAYQVRRYGWSAKLPISIITDFEEFAVYDCTKKPAANDLASNARIKYIVYTQYVEEFDYIWNTFSKERVLKGSFDKYVLSDSYKKGTSTVDKDFLKSLDSWRTILAKATFSQNKNLDEDELNYIVQQTIDRIIFLRIAEDRGVEPYGELKKIITSGTYYDNLFKLYLKADDKYNSGLFDFKKDKLSQAVRIDNKTIKAIVEELYYPHCPYEFSVLPIEILGTAYEQFLGKKIEIKSSNRISIEEKPDVRKAGGVYYTPQYIVNYIVKGTIGNFINGKSPKEISKLKIVDPACGSGSFLIGAYQYLLDYHKSYYNQDGKLSKGSKNNPLTPDGNLTTSEKKRILINNIYGVDIDVNAVEVTKLSLLLKCMEGETAASIETQMRLFHDRVLPSLEKNIKCGNSLIDTDYYDNELDLGEERIIKPFSWKNAFPEISAQGGFDAVIGNPPYVDSRANDLKSKKYWKDHYVSSRYGKTNTYEIFIEKGLRLLKTDGLLGYIVPIVLLNVDACKALRELLVNDYLITEISYGDFPVFADANVDTMVILISGAKKNKGKANVKKFSQDFLEVLESKQISLSEITQANDYKISVKDSGLTKGTAKNPNRYTKISEIIDFYNGIATGPDKDKYFSSKKENDTYKPLLMGNNIGHYETNWDTKYINYDRKKLHRPREESIFLASEKIIMQRIRNLKLERRLVCTLDTEQFYTFNSVNNLILKEDSEYNIRYVLGLLNSNLLNKIFKERSLNTNITLGDLEEVPIRKIDFSNQNEKAIHDEIVKNVDKILAFNKEKKGHSLQSKIDQVAERSRHACERIEELVLKLYEGDN